MPPKLYKAADVCEMAQLQPYVLRSWEKEFPGIGVQRTVDGPRLYRQSDVDQVLRIKQLVFGEGLTLAGARRRLEDGSTPVRPATLPSASIPSREPVEPSLDDGDRLRAVDGYDDLRARLASVRHGLQGILDLLSGAKAHGAAAADATTADATAAATEDVDESSTATAARGDHDAEYQLEPPVDEPAVQPVRTLTPRRAAAATKTKKPAAVAKRKRASA
jgi:DNA-binding transcriptional MerR regulator